MKQLAMEEATDGTTGSAGGAPEKQNDQVEVLEGDTSTAPGADEGAAAASDPVPTGPQFTPGAVALVTKGIDRLPVQLRDQAHLDALISEHGTGGVEVQS
jgi:hypothetical protein